MCSWPVTLGGGSTIVYGGRSLLASAVKYPPSSQRWYSFASTAEGAYCDGRSDDAAGRSGSVAGSAEESLGITWPSLERSARDGPTGQRGQAAARNGRELHRPRARAHRRTQ